jgi:hypothetical protein
MNSEEKIYSKIKNASHKGEKEFPGMDKVWNRVEEKLDNTLLVQKKNTWQKLAIAATVLLSFSIIYQFVSNDEISKDKINNNTTNPVIVSHDSVEKIIDKAKEVVVENNNTKVPNNKVTDFYKSETNSMKSTYFNLGTAVPDVMIDDTVEKINVKASAFSNYNNSNLSNSAFNSAHSNTDYLLRGRKFETNTANYDWPTEKKAETQEAQIATPIEKNKDLVVIDGVAMDKRYNADKELEKLSTEEIADTTYLPNPLYIINGIEYSEASLSGDNPTSPYAPLDKQKITATTILKPADATKIYGKKGENGIVIITTKDGKPAKN